MYSLCTKKYYNTVIYINNNCISYDTIHFIQFKYLIYDSVSLIHNNGDKEEIFNNFSAL